MSVFSCSLVGLIVGMSTGRLMNGCIEGTLTAKVGCDLLTDAGAGLIGASLADLAFRLLGLRGARITVYEFVAELVGAFVVTTFVYLLQAESRRKPKADFPRVGSCGERGAPQ